MTARLKDVTGPSCRQWFPAILESWFCITVEFHSASRSSSVFQKMLCGTYCLHSRLHWILLWDLGTVSRVTWQSHWRLWIHPQFVKKLRCSKLYRDFHIHSINFDKCKIAYCLCLTSSASWLRDNRFAYSFLDKVKGMLAREQESEKWRSRNIRHIIKPVKMGMTET